jgi:ArsR family transcriptional regulator
MHDSNINIIATKVKSLAHPVRLRILCLLLDGEKNVGEIHGHFPTTYANISQHLQKLHNIDLLSSEKRANFIYYSIKDQKIFEMIKVLKKLYCQNG